MRHSTLFLCILAACGSDGSGGDAAEESSSTSGVASADGTSTLGTSPTQGSTSSSGSDESTSTRGTSPTQSSSGTDGSSSSGTDSGSSGSGSDGSSSSSGDSSGGSSSSSSSTGNFIPEEWSIEILDTDSVVAGTTAIDVDDAGGVHIAYLDVNGGQDRLQYAHWDGADWSFAMIDDGRTGWHCSLRLDPSGVPHVTHYAFSVGDLRYSTLQGDEWVTETIDEDGAVGRKSSLRFAPDGFARISYHDTSEDDLKYASNGPGGWTIETVDAADVTGDFTSLDLDASGHPHIAYNRILEQFGGGGGDLRYAQFNGVDWDLSTVDDVGVVGHFTSLALDDAGDAHISYRDDTNGYLKYATGSPGAWAIEVVDNSGQAGDFNTSLALDADGNPHISYYDSTTGELRYASWDGSEWTILGLDDELFSGHYSSLHIDDIGVARISYSYRADDSPNPVGVIGLKYAFGPASAPVR